MLEDFDSDKKVPKVNNTKGNKAKKVNSNTLGSKHFMAHRNGSDSTEECNTLKAKRQTPQKTMTTLRERKEHEQDLN